ncbi:nuclear transport factor 2 family protein [Streptomyces sp. GESEQ-35]|uniref:nuclear transport factor 2 family protein n=1 Tax=Streptomyces sp. GESEQ-35 TaxID=2812657 RepID=UPI0027E2D99C|nr:nuclear transport factor 2 family protein [Streptomyces sp. GESEQ-35]
MNRRSFLAGSAKIAAIPALAAVAGGVLAEPAAADSQGKSTVSNNESIIRRAYQIADDVDIPGWTALFTEDGTFTDVSVPFTYVGNTLDKPIADYAKAFPDIHRELERVFVAGNMIFVQLRLQGTHTGPLVTPSRTIPPTGKRIDAPCADVFELKNGKIKRFDHYPEYTVIASQLGVS